MNHLGRTVLLASVLAVVAACGGANNPQTSPTTAGPTPTAVATPGDGPAATSPATWSSQPVTVTHNVPVAPVPVLLRVRSATHSPDGYDRIVFDYSGPLPGYEVRYVPKVIGDASGQEIAMPGRRYLQVIFRPAQAHTDTASTVSGRTDLNYPMLKGYVVAGDFEAVLTIAFGLDDTVGFHVGELTDPNRIYLDVAA